MQEYGTISNMPWSGLASCAVDRFMHDWVLRHLLHPTIIFEATSLGLHHRHRHGWLILMPLGELLHTAQRRWGWGVLEVSPCLGMQLASVWWGIGPLSSH